jgi:hypothetical protein
LTVYHRPFPPIAQRRPAHGAGWPAPPAIGRYELPEGGRAAAPVLRFVAQAFILSTAALLLVQAVRWVWPAGCLVLFGVAGVALLAGAGLKWLWGGRAAAVPVLTAATILSGALWVLGSLGREQSLAGVFAIGIGVVLLMQLTFVARWADALTMSQDWQATLALGVVALLLILFGLVPPSFTALRVLGAVTTVANFSFMIAATIVYANYVLANPIHPQEVIAVATARWHRAVWGPVIRAGISCAVVIALAIGVPEPTGEFAAALRRAIAPVGPPEDAAAAPLWARLAVPGFIAFCGMIGFDVVRYGRACWRAFMVWMLYGAGSEQAPGIYRPAGWVGSARARQALFAALVVANVLLFRVPFALDRLLPAVVGRPANSPEYDSLLRIVLADFAVTLVLPLLLPAVLWLALAGKELRTIHDQVEAAPPKDLYPDEPDAANEPQRLLPKH